MGAAAGDGLSGAGWAVEVRWLRAPWHLHCFFLGIHSLIHAADHRVWLPEGWGGPPTGLDPGSPEPRAGEDKMELVGGQVGGRCCHKQMYRQTDRAPRV